MFPTPVGMNRMLYLGAIGLWGFKFVASVSAINAFIVTQAVDHFQATSQKMPGIQREFIASEMQECLDTTTFTTLTNRG